jgi:hypothetical protein
MRIATALLAATLLGAPLAAQQPGVPAPEVANTRAGQPGAPTTADVAGLRVNQLVIFEGDTCPPSQGDTINVCAILPGSERFRIPENLRTDPGAPENQSWTNKAIALSYVGREGIGSCSTSGPAGFTGCAQQLINQAVAERRGGPQVNWARLIEEARQERLAGINTAAAQEELSAGGNRRVQELRIRQGQFCPPSTESVIIVCTYPDGTAAPTQPAGEPQIPISGRGQPAGSVAQPQPPRP